ncbi:MAG: hypothetical protein KIT02_00110 [Devosia sp.]|uniref:hypothetical protein n=1 Tax=Devosia sp. TaxID=1871048 RepID=UPI0024C650BD|nr:hypothetical protein [Devosia sp.]UYN99691.1 MAG: hypothetical protein KIT02_00110 [Devosia sp.]
MDIDSMEAPPAQPDWGVIRAEYESRQFIPTVICRRHGVTLSQLRYRREVEGWTSIKMRVPTTAKLVARMLRVLEGQIKELEQAMDSPIDKQASVLASQVKTLDKLIELGAAERNVEPPSKRDMTDLRAKLVKRLDQFKAR